MSSLAAQLAQSVSLNAAQLVDRTKRKPAPSYLLTGKDADQLDLSAAHALGHNAFLHLVSTDAAFAKFEDALFSEHAKETDRTLLTKEQNQDLDVALQNFLLRLGPHLLEAPTGRIIEWLVRRFRIHEFNVESVLALFLPYHESPHFIKMISILKIEPNSAWTFLLPYKSAAQKLHRVSLVTEMLKNSEVARFVVSLVPLAIKKRALHQVLITFNAATLHDFIQRARLIDEGTMAQLFPALLEPLQQKAKYATTDAILASYILLSAVSQKTQLTSAALKVIIKAMVACSSFVTTEQLMKSIVAICEPQDEVEISGDLVHELLCTKQITESICSALGRTGGRKLVAALAKGMLTKLSDETVPAILRTIVTHPSSGPAFAESLSAGLIPVALAAHATQEEQLVARDLLGFIQQRYSSSVHQAFDRASDADPAVKDALDQLRITLSLVSQNLLSISSSHPAQQEQTGAATADGVGADMILGCSSVDPKLRCVAVKELIELARQGKLGDDELVKTSLAFTTSLADISPKGSVRTTLLARLQDDDPAVVETLYDDSDKIAEVFLTDIPGLVSALELAIGASSSKLKRSVLRLHLNFIASYVWPRADDSTKDALFHKVIFPFLLFSKSRQKSAELVWSLVNEQLSKAPTASLAIWTSNCQPFTSLEIPDGGDTVEALSAANIQVSHRVAENVIASDNLQPVVLALIDKMADENAQTRSFSYLIAISLLQQLPAERAVGVAYTILRRLSINEISGIGDVSSSTGVTVLDQLPHGKLVVTKTHSPSTLKWLQTALIVTASRVQRPESNNLNWFIQTDDPVTPIQQFVILMRLLYQLANASSTVPVLASVVLQSIFLNLQDEALAFLAGVWSTSSAANEVKRLALLHGAAFLEAHILEGDGIDFQTILPSLLVVLVVSDTPLIQAALECVSRIDIISQNKLSSVYRFDTIYGESSASLQYLDQADLKGYLTGLLEHRDHLLHDRGYLKVLHGEFLNPAPVDKKKGSDFKHRITCFILSHVSSLPTRQAQFALLDSLALVKERGRIVVLLPTINHLIEAGLPPVDEPIYWAFVDRLLDCFDSTAANHLNQSEDAWGVLLRVLHVYFKPDVPPPVKDSLKHRIENGLFVSLNSKRKQALLEALVSLGTAEDSKTDCKAVLSAVLTDATLMVHLLQWTSPQALTQSPRTAKRVKTTEAEPSDDIARLTLLAEVLGTRPLPGSLGLVTRLLDTLNQVVQTLPPTHPNMNYIEQLLMSAIESSASKINVAPNISPSVIRLEVLVELIRVANNPQTFHQALLLMASLTRLAPESVLYNVMPVFTFMGSNVFHRDDTYSFKVVQETINGIVPTMAASLRESHSEPLQLNIASREFLRVFTDAASHIPRHRRNNFFIHLTEVLGARDFLPPICMLLVEKLANKVVRQQSEELQALLALPIAVFQQADPGTQKDAAIQILEEVHRLVKRMTDPTSPLPTFLEGTSEGDHSASIATLLRRRSQALLLFIGHAFKARPRSSPAAEGPSMSTIMAHLIQLAELSDTTNKDLGLGNIADAANATMSSILRTMSVAEFMQSIEVMLRSDNIKVQSGALELVGSRASDISQKARQDVSGTVNTIFGLIKNLFTIHKRGTIVAVALEAVRGLADTLCPGEEGSLSEIVPYVIAFTQDAEPLPSALWALSIIPVKLGPRIIPFFRQIVSQTVTILRGANAALYEPAFATLKGLLSTIPTFWGSGEVSQLVYLYMDNSATPAMTAHLNRLMKAIAKKTPSKSLLPGLLDMWSSFKSSQNLSRFMAFFEVLSLCLQHADRGAVMEHVRAIFSLFLDGFDIVSKDHNAENRAISAFKELVVKLNETAFKPLFRRLYDWAFVGDGARDSRKVTFGHLFSTLLDFFKGLMVPYTSFLLQSYIEILQSYQALKSQNVELWSSVINTLTRSLSFDDGGFWRNDRLRDLSTSLIAQVPVSTLLGSADCKSSLQECFAAFVENINDDTLVKSVNLALLMHTRSEDARVRAYALICATGLWQSHSNKLLGFVPETATFISECGEDEHDLVVKEAFRLKEIIESVAGKIDGL